MFPSLPIPAPPLPALRKQGRVCLLCANTARGRTGPAARRDPPSCPGRLPVRIPGEAPGGRGKASGGDWLRGDAHPPVRYSMSKWINDGQARWPVDEQRSGSAGCGSAGKAGSPTVGAVGSGECSRTPARPPSLNGNNYPGDDSVSSGYFNYGGSIRRVAEPLGATFAKGSKGHSRRRRRCLPSAHPPCLLCVPPALWSCWSFPCLWHASVSLGGAKVWRLPKKRRAGNFRVFQFEPEATGNLGGELGMLQHRVGRSPIQPWRCTLHPRNLFVLYRAEKY